MLLKVHIYKLLITFMSIANTSVSRIEIEIVISDTHIVNAEFKRHLSPLTIKKLTNMMPISGLISKYHDKFVYIKTSLDTGAEKPISYFMRGNIAFSASGNFLCLFLRDTSVAQKFSLLGSVISDNLNLLQTVKAGDSITIRKLKG